MFTYTYKTILAVSVALAIPNSASATVSDPYAVCKGVTAVLNKLTSDNQETRLHLWDAIHKPGHGADMEMYTDDYQRRFGDQEAWNRAKGAGNHTSDFSDIGQKISVAGYANACEKYFPQVSHPPSATQGVCVPYSGGDQCPSSLPVGASCSCEDNGTLAPGVVR